MYSLYIDISWIYTHNIRDTLLTRSLYERARFFITLKMDIYSSIAKGRTESDGAYHRRGPSSRARRGFDCICEYGLAERMHANSNTSWPQAYTPGKYFAYNFLLTQKHPKKIHEQKTKRNRRNELLLLAGFCCFVFHLPSVGDLGVVAYQSEPTWSWITYTHLHSRIFERILDYG